MDTRLKERLVGAVALVLIVVLVVPELLTGPHRKADPAAADGPKQVRTVVVDLGHSESGEVTRSAPSAPLLAPPSGPSTPASSPASAPATATASTPGSAPASAPESAPAPPALAAAPPVRVAPGATEPAAAKPASAPAKAAPPGAEAPKPEPAKASSAKADKADRAPDKVPAAKAPEPAKAATPEPAKAAAHPPKATVSAGDGWVVQLGSFASRENGEKLAKALRGKGYRAFVSEFRGSGRVLFRVRVGPEQDRARAEAIASRLSRDGYKGSVAPH